MQKQTGEDSDSNEKDEDEHVKQRVKKANKGKKKVNDREIVQVMKMNMK